MMSKVRMRIVGALNGEPTEFDCQYVVSYDVDYVHPQGYDGGLLVTTPLVAEAAEFPSAVEAHELWRSAHGLRRDGKPNRPLTAFTVEIEPV